MFTLITTSSPGSTPPIPYFANGIHCLTLSNDPGLMKNSKKSGILNTKVVIVTALKIKAEASLVGMLLSIISTMVIG